MIKKTVLITGASSGIGEATAKLLIDNGFIVFGAARRMDRMSELQQMGVRILRLDLANDKSIKCAIADVLNCEGRIDILINNAGLGLLGAVEDIALEDARYQMEVNVFGLARLMQLVLPHMRRQQAGKILNITSTSGKVAGPLAGWYAASKFAVEALSDSLRMEVKEFGIDVMVVEPGAVKSEWSAIAKQSLYESSVGKAYGKMAGKILGFSGKAERRMTDPSIIARLILDAITAQKPKTRYYAGYRSGALLLLKKVLTDKQMDRLLLNQIK